MEDECDSNQTNMGVEWDWLVFFWGLWTEDATYRYSIQEITAVWNKVHDNDPLENPQETWVWEDPVNDDGLVEAAYDLYGNDEDKYQYFLDRGDWAGVNY